MKILSILKKILVITLTILLTNSCVTQEFEVPEITCTEPNLVVTNTIAQVKEMYAYGNAKLIEENVVIEGYVVSSDESGNMYKTISIQDKPENPTAAIKIAVDATNLYTKFNVGRKIFVNLKGLGIGYSFGSLQIGKISQNELTRISSFEIDTYIKRSCEVAEIIPKKVQISDLNPSMLEMLIELENVQFKQNEIENTYGNPNNTATVSRTLEQFDNSCKLIQEIKVRNSGFSSFKNEQLPTGKGSVVAICLSMATSFFFNKEILSLIIRRSVSISVSPGPRIPIPPFWRSRCVHNLVSLGSKYWHCANSTWVRA